MTFFSGNNINLKCAFKGNEAGGRGYPDPVVNTGVKRGSGC